MARRENVSRMTSDQFWCSLKAVIIREWRLVTTHSIYLVGMVIAPLVTLFFMLSLMQYGLPSSLPLAVVDLDNTKTTRSLIRNLDAFDQTDIVMNVSDFTKAREAMQRGEVYGILLIPRDFTASATSGKQPKITYYTNNNVMMGGSLLFRDMKVISEMASGAVGLQVGLAKGELKEEIMGKVQPISVKAHITGNTWLNYSIYLNSVIIPGVLQLLILQMTVYAIGVEIKKRTSREWLAKAGGSIHVALLGKLLVHTAIYMAVGLCCLGIIYGIVGFPLNSGWAPMIVAMLLLILAAESLGILFISLLPILRLGLSLASLFGMLAFSISGFSFPVTAMHGSVRALSNLFPLRHYFLIYADQALNGIPLSYSLKSYGALILLMLIPLFNLRNLREELLLVKYIP